MAAGSWRLAETHRLAQRRLGTETIRITRAITPLLDLTNLDGTTPRWLRANLSVVGAQHRQSAQLAATYLRTARALDLGPTDLFTPTAAAFDVERAATAMRGAGPAAARRLTVAGFDIPEIRERVTVSIVRAAARQAMAGGRDTVTTTIANDTEAIGWQRIGSGDTCGFCSMLISRGPSYRSEASATFRAHDNCSCGAMAIYSPDNEWTDQAQSLRDAWDETTSGLHGKDALNAFRRTLAAG